MMRTVFVTFLPAFLLTWACTAPSEFEEFKDIANQTWHTDSTLVFSFPITDTLSTYRVSYQVRNQEDYPFANIYVKFELTAPNGEVLRNGMHESLLMDLKTGRPLGESSIGSIYTNTTELFNTQQFPRSGTYTLSFRQYLRPDALSGIQAFGVRVEKLTGAPN